MKTKFSLLALLLLLSYQSFSQDVKENQIRVVGKYQETLFAKKYELNFIIQEVTSMSGGEKQVLKSMDAVKKEFLAYLKSEKLFEGDFTFMNQNNQSYGNKGSNYSFVVADLNKANQIVQSTKIAGINNITIKYLFEYDDDDINKLAAKAIDNAKSKADFMAKKLNKKIGAVISVDDNTNNEISLLGNANLFAKKSDKEAQQEVGYSIFITYELLNQ
ncbi:SIMPL domain-containing protein [Flavobacterium terrisoli]|uniref:SIMPL domain-containing protein n=1 Tax=Flavobacterium terrisoli TaxID=3242195 RepID=UPI002542CE2C|nr:SIMPL domain-containing protein [Flavobacterium buctense]